MTLETSNSSSRPQFGGRVLEKDGDVFKHNAWDNVEWGKEQQEEAQEMVDKATSVLMDAEKAKECEEKAGEFWDKFYSVHQNRFFKERNWLFTEFPDLAPRYTGAVRVFQPGQVADTEKDQVVGDSDTTEHDKVATPLDQTEVDALRNDESYFGSNANFRLLEIGCGTGSTVFPILEMNTSPSILVYCCDLSTTAVQLVKDHPQYASKRCFSWVCDVTQDWQPPFPDNSLDVVTLIFVLSAISPAKMQAVVKNIVRYLKPGGQVMFRDYGRYDLAQLRFKEGKCIQENFYARGDGTRCYFFTQEEIRDMFVSEGLVEVQNLVDRRLQVNRGKKLKMYRVWIQAKYKKPVKVSL
jgi:SAM-dependent methyltransferase